MGGMDLSEWVVEKSMKCNNCGTHMKRALYNSEGWSERLVILDDYNPATGRYETTGVVVYCPKCGNLQVELERTIEVCERRWIPAEERLPDSREEMVLACDRKGGITLAWFEENKWFRITTFAGDYDYKVVAWMPLPEPYRPEN